MERIEALPISLWREQVPKQRRLLNAVHQVQALHSAFHISALELDILLQQFSRSFGTRIGLSLDHSYVISYVFALQGFASEAILPWIGLGTGPPADWLNDARDTAKADPTITAANERYAQCRKELTAAVDALTQVLNA